MKLNKKRVLSFSLALLLSVGPMTSNLFAQSSDQNTKKEEINDVKISDKKVTEKADIKQVKNALNALKDAENKLKVTNISKLKAEILKDKEVRENKYFNKATQKDKANYENALAAAKSISTDEKASEEQIANAIFGLEDAQKSLSNDYAGLILRRISYENELRNSKSYKNADKKLSSNWESALAAAKSVAKDKIASKSQRQNAYYDLLEAEEKINVRDIFDLKEMIKEENKIRNSNEYKNLDKKLSSNWENALAAAKATVDDYEI